MAKRAPANPDQFEEASKWFRGRTPVTKAEWDSMSKQARRQAFTVAGTQQLKVVQSVFDSIQKAIDNGTPLEQWRKELKEKLHSDFADKNSATLTTAFINANQTAYNTGRYYQLMSPEVTAVMGYICLDAVLDGHTTDLCIALDGTTRKHDDPWWLTHWPPFHHRCRTSPRALSAAMLKRRGGITKELPRPVIHDDWGLAPPLRVGQVWEPKREDFDPTAWRMYQQSQERMKRKAANDNAGPPSKRLGELGERIFGRKLTDADIDELAGIRAKLPPGHTLVVSVRETAKRDRVEIGAGIIDKNKNVVGTFGRDYTRVGDKLTVHNASFFLDKSVQNSGIGKSLFNAQVDAYAKHGVDKVTLEAAEVGKYVWTKAGFEWTNQAQVDSAFGKFEKRLKREVGAAEAAKIMSSVHTPEDISRVVVGEKRIGKKFLIDMKTDGGAKPHIEMSQTPSKIKRL